MYYSSVKNETDAEQSQTTDEPQSLFNELYRVRQDGPGWAILRKIPLSDHDYQALRLNDTEIGYLKQVGPRSIYHLNRMLEIGRSPHERVFALAFAQHAPDLVESLRKNKSVYRRIRFTLNGESNDTCMWWTLSPNIFELFKEKLGDKEAIQKLLRWGQDSDEDDIATVHLKGLEAYNAFGTANTFTLGRDPQGYSHDFAKKEAKRLVNAGIFE